MLFLTQNHTYRMTSEDLSAGGVWTTFTILLWCVYVLFLILKLQSQFNCNLPTNYQDFSLCLFLLPTALLSIPSSQITETLIRQKQTTCNRVSLSWLLSTLCDNEIQWHQCKRPSTMHHSCATVPLSVVINSAKRFFSLTTGPAQMFFF